MVNEVTRTNRRVPSLVSFCQRVASANVENISSLGEDTPIDLIRPILQNCSPDVLVRFEQASPGICSETPELWKALCFRTFPLMAEEHFATQMPECWRDAYFLLRDFEKERLDAVAAKLREKREEERKRKEGIQIKLTDKLPPIKRSRGNGWGTTSPKTLFQRARLDTVKFSKGVYAAHMNPTLPVSKANRLPGSSLSSNTSKPLISTAPSPIPSSSGNTTGTRVTVTSVYKHQSPSSKPTPVPPLNPTHSTTHSAGNLPLSSPIRSNLSLSNPPIRGNTAILPPSQKPVYPRLPGELRTVAPKVRKDSSSILFLPKPRGQVYVPTHSNSMRSRA